MYDDKLKRLRLARREFELALNEFEGMEIDVRVGHLDPQGFQRNDRTGPWKVVAKVIIDSERVSSQDDFG